MIKDIIKKSILKNGGHYRILSFIYTMLGRNSYSIGRGNNLKIKGSFLRRTKIVIKGKGNTIWFDEAGNNHLCNTYIEINGNNNFIKLGRNNSLYNSELIIDDDGGSITMGNDNKICGKTHFAAIEGTSISFGDGCLFSSDVTFRTGDSHSIISTETEKRINPSLSIKIGNRVWFGNHTTILKGVTLQDDTIVGTGSLVTKSCEESCVAIAGTPASIVKRNVRWETERIPILKTKL